MDLGEPSGLRVVLARPEFVVVDKPAWLLSVPGKGPGKADCVVARVKGMFPHAAGPMVVHRLDMETSGLMVVALTVEAQRELSRQFEARTVEKRYEALLEGIVDETEFGPAMEGRSCARGCEGAGGANVIGGWRVIRVPMRVDLEDRPRQMVDALPPRGHGREAVTEWCVLGHARLALNGGPQRMVTRVEFRPLTGRTHQLRVHAAAAREMGGLGAPIVGDALYGGADVEPGRGRLMLHATRLEFDEPGKGARAERVVAESAAPF